MAIKHKPALTQQAHVLIKEHFSQRNMQARTAIDATCGNGLDTLFLAEYVSEKTYAFDIQAIALHNTNEKLVSNQLAHKVELIACGHENILKHVKSTIDIGMFNFGYLPQADKSITTMTETSIEALENALSLLSGHGILSILCYPGHTEGKRETVAITKYLDRLSDSWSIKKYLSNYPSDKSPILYLVHQA